MTINLDNPQAVADYIRSSLEQTAPGRTRLERDESSTSEVWRLWLSLIHDDTHGGFTSQEFRVEIGFDPYEDGILWDINGDTFGDGTQWDMIQNGGWAPGDKDTAEAEIAGIICTLNDTSPQQMNG